MKTRAAQAVLITTLTLALPGIPFEDAQAQVYSGPMKTDVVILSSLNSARSHISYRPEGRRDMSRVKCYLEQIIGHTQVAVLNKDTTWDIEERHWARFQKSNPGRVSLWAEYKTPTGLHRIHPLVGELMNVPDDVLVWVLDNPASPSQPQNNVDSRFVRKLQPKTAAKH